MSTKRILAFLLAVVMTVIPMSALANEAELGSYDNPWHLSTTSVRFAVTVEPESEAWVQVDDSNGSTLTVGYATTADYMIVYCRQPYYPETETGDNTLTVTMVNGADMFSVYNAGTEAVTVYMALTAGAGSEVAYGTMDNPEPVTFAKDWFGNLAADMYVDLEAGSQGYYYTCTAPADGVITVTVGAVDAEYNSVGWMFGVNNMTSYVYGDYHFSDNEPFCNYDTVKVSQGDVVEVFVNTYNPDDMWNPPAATVNTQFSFYSIGTYECPDEPVMGTNEADIAEGSFGYYYTWTAAESGYLTVSMCAESWTYGINVERANGEYFYGDTHYSDDETVVPSETVTVYAGDKVTLFVNTYDPESWSAPAGLLTWELSFEAEELEAPEIPDTPLGAYDNPYELFLDGDNLGVYVEPGAEAWIKVDSTANTVVAVGYATNPNFMLVYCRQPYYPETETGNNTLSVAMVDGADMFTVYNSGEEGVTVYMALTQGEGGDVTYGTWDNPEPVTLMADWFGGLNASVSAELAAGNQGYYYTLTVPADGLLTVRPNAMDADFNYIGWIYNINVAKADGTYYYGDNHWSDDDPVVSYESLNVSAGDVVTVFVATYDPADMWNNPAGTVMVDFSLEAVGTWGNPDTDIQAGEQETTLDAGNNGYHYLWTATEDGTVTITMNGDNWTYNVNAEKIDGTFYYGDNHWYDDDPAVPSETLEVSAGDRVTIMVGTYDAENPWSTPAGTVSWTLTFEGEGGSGDVEDPIEIPYGDRENPWLLFLDGDRLAVSVEPGAEAWIKADNADNTLVTVGYATASYMLVYGTQAYYPEKETGDNTLTVTLVDGADTFSIFNSGSETVVVYMTLTVPQVGPSCGTWDNPEEVTLAVDWFGGLNASVSAELAAGNQGYYYTLTVPADGLLTVGPNAIDAEYNFIGWIYNVNIARADGTYYYGDNHWSDDDPTVYFEKLHVSAGDVVTVFVATYDPADMWNNPAGTVMVDFSLEAVGTWGNPDTNIEAGEQETTLDAGNNGYHYLWTATEDGTVTITMNGDNWTYNVNAEKIDGTFYYGDNHWYDEDPASPAETLEVSAGDRVTIMVGTYDAENPWSTPAGTVSWSLTFTAGTGETPVEKQDGYAETGIALEVGTADYELDATYKYTVYFFEPTETGKYTFTASNGLIALVSYNGMWVTIEPTAETVTSSTFEWECGSVGQSILVAAIGDEATVSITVEKEAVEIIEIPWTPYENVVTPESFTFVSNGNLLQYVDTLDDICNVAVLGEDGFYHLDSADGPILYVDLDDTTLSLADAMGYGQLRYTLTVDGEAVAKIDYNEAFAAYVACADEATLLYPLTEDLITVYKNVGIQQGWYGESGWIGGDLEDSWMFACYYQAENTKVEINVNDEEILTDGKTDFSGNWSEVGTGDVVLVNNGNCTVAGMDVTLLYALGETTKINSVTIDLYHCAGVMIGYPEGYAIILISTDGETYTEVGAFDLTAAEVANGAYGTVSSTFEFDAVEAAYVKILLYAGSNEAVLGDSPADDKFYWEFIAVAEVAVGEVEEGLFGDINGDGKVNSADYVLLKRHIMGTYKLNDDQLSRSDINGDGRVQMADYVLLKRYIMKTWTPN